MIESNYWSSRILLDIVLFTSRKQNPSHPHHLDCMISTRSRANKLPVCAPHTLPKHQFQFKHLKFKSPVFLFHPVYLQKAIDCVSSNPIDSLKSSVPLTFLHDSLALLLFCVLFIFSIKPQRGGKKKSPLTQQNNVERNVYEVGGLPSPNRSHSLAFIEPVDFRSFWISSLPCPGSRWSFGVPSCWLWPRFDSCTNGPASLLVRSVNAIWSTRIGWLLWLDRWQLLRYLSILAWLLIDRREQPTTRRMNKKSKTDNWIWSCPLCWRNPFSDVHCQFHGYQR